MNCRAVILPVLFMAVSACAQTAARPIEPNGPAAAANSQKTYAALRADQPGTAGVTVRDLTLVREGARFTFVQGEFYFYAPVEGRVTGAVFVGQGRFELMAKNVSEMRSIALLTHSNAMTQEFTTLVLRFTDGTADEIRVASVGASSARGEQVRGAAEDLAKGFRNEMHENLELRLLADVIGGGEDGGRFFLASFRMVNMRAIRNVLYMVDPEGTFHASPDEVELTTWSDVELQPWVSYVMQEVDENDLGRRVQVSDERLDVTLDRTGMMKTSAETTMKVLRDGVRVVRLNLYPTLRVAGVYSESGAALEFVQEDKDSDADFAVVLPAAAKAGDTLRLLTVYSGRDALHPDGNLTYHLMSGAHASWYPSGGGGMSDFANFHMTFHLPKNLQIVASGKQVSLAPEAGGMKAVWESGAPIPVAGFELGNLKLNDGKTPSGLGVDGYANIGIPDRYVPLDKSNTMGSLSTVPALKGAMSQGIYAIQIFSDYFGKLPYDHVSLTQQSDCSNVQNWPMLVSQPICGFWSRPVQHQLGLLDYDTTYWTAVTPHEVSHQWWGTLVGFDGYRDRWMSEGFSNFSVGVFLRHTTTKSDEFRDFWQEQQSNLLQKNTQGVRPVDAGPLTMRPPLTNTKSVEDVYRVMIFSKGAMVLHMLEMMYWNPTDLEETFKHSLQQFVTDYSGKEATAEDWKASMEKTLPKWLDLRGDGKLDWFFDEYVYGTELPRYTISSDFTVGADGKTSCHLKLTQSNVSKNFVMLIPLYLELTDGQVARYRNVVIHGDDTLDQTINLGKLPQPAKAMLVNYNADVLSDN